MATISPFWQISWESSAFEELDIHFHKFLVSQPCDIPPCCYSIMACEVRAFLFPMGPGVESTYVLLAASWLDSKLDCRDYWNNAYSLFLPSSLHIFSSGPLYMRPIYTCLPNRVPHSRITIHRLSNIFCFIIAGKLSSTNAQGNFLSFRDPETWSIVFVAGFTSSGLFVSNLSILDRDMK